MQKYWSRVTSSARGEAFNPLIWPALFATLAYGIGFGILLPLGAPLGTSSLYDAMNEVHGGLAMIWGLTALVTIVSGVFFLLFNKPPMGKFSGLLGFMVWLFAGIIYLITGNILVFWAVTFPNMWFWFWQYLSLAVFNKEDAADQRTMEAYDAGRYDDRDNPKDSKIDREGNRGQEVQ